MSFLYRSRLPSVEKVSNKVIFQRWKVISWCCCCLAISNRAIRDIASSFRWCDLWCLLNYCQTADFTSSIIYLTMEAENRNQIIFRLLAENPTEAEKLISLLISVCNCISIEFIARFYPSTDRTAKKFGGGNTEHVHFSRFCGWHVVIEVLNCISVC